MYRKIGEITRFSEIPWGKEIIVSCYIGKSDWVWAMKGVFEQNSNGYRFKNELGMSIRFSPDDFISLNVLEKVSAARCPENAPKSYRCDADGEVRSDSVGFGEPGCDDEDGAGIYCKKLPFRPIEGKIMDIQEAIKNLESTFEAKTMLSGEAMKMAISALQEQAEREKGCKYCQPCGWCTNFDRPCDDVCEKRLN